MKRALAICALAFLAACSDSGKRAEDGDAVAASGTASQADVAATNATTASKDSAPAAAVQDLAAAAAAGAAGQGAIDAAAVTNIVSALTEQLAAAHAAETKKLAEAMIAAQKASDEAAAKRDADAKAELKAAEEKADKEKKELEAKLAKQEADEKAEKKAAEEKAEKERKEAEAKAEKEKKEAEEKAEKERKEAEAKAEKKAAEDKVAAEKKASEDKAAAETRLKTISSRTWKLQFASADDVAEKLNAMWSGDFGEKWKTSKVAQSFPDANVVMVSAPGGILDACEEVIRAIDVQPMQVYIEARFVELSNEAFHNLGIDWGMLNGMKGTVSLGGGYESYKLGDAVQNFSRTVTGNSSSDKMTYGLADSTSSHTAEKTVTTDAEGKTTTTDTSSTTSTSSGNDGSISRFTGTLDFSDLYMVLYALEGAQDARVFSNPKIIVSSGKKAKVDMTTKYPNVKISAKRTTGTSDSVDIAANMEAIPGEDKMMFAKEAFFSWGLSLEVTPRISTNGVINVSIVPTISSQTDWVETGTSATDGSSNSGTISSKYPVIDVQRLVTEFSMKSEATAVIGGLSRTVESQVDNGIPYLRDIPWFGEKLFGKKMRSKVQKEIIVFVTVGIVDPNDVKKDQGLPKNAVLGRQYVDDIRREPGDRRRTRPEGMDSLDLRSLEEQARDPRRLKRAEEGMLKRFPMPFTKKVPEPSIEELEAQWKADLTNENVNASSSVDP